jgi:hypothetical protein
MGFDHDLCVLFFYHQCDELTKTHLASLQKSNPTAFIQPVADSALELLPGSVDVGRFPSSFANVSKWRSIDARLYRWFENRTINARRYVVLEYDCLCTVDLNEYYPATMEADVVGADYFTRRANPRWQWFADNEINQLPKDDRPFASAIVPLHCAMYSHEGLKAIVANVYKGDVFCELRLGTTVAKLGLKFQRLPVSRRSTICWHIYPWQVNRPGLFHSVKSLGHDEGKRRQPNLVGMFIHDRFRSFHPGRGFLPFYVQRKWRKLSE